MSFLFSEQFFSVEFLGHPLVIRVGHQWQVTLNIAFQRSLVDLARSDSDVALVILVQDILKRPGLKLYAVGSHRVGVIELIVGLQESEHVSGYARSVFIGGGGCDVGRVDESVGEFSSTISRNARGSR